jgi:hypothetical protein
MRVVDLVSVAPGTTRTLARAASLRAVLLSPRVALGVVAFGAALRVVRYLADRSLWLDESLLTINLMTRSYGDLVTTLDYNQGAPVGFLWVERLMLDLFGDSELTLRFLPLVVSLASLVLFYLLARELLGAAAGLVAVVLFATIEPFVRYSAEVKQYSFDILVTVALLYLFVRYVEDGESSIRRTVLLSLAGPFAVAFSHPSVFVLAGVAVAGLYLALRRRDTRALIHQGVGYGVWVLSFLVVYLVAVRDLRDLQQTVRGFGSSSGSRLKNLYTIFNDPGGFPRTAVGLAAAVALVGAIYLWRRRPGVVVLFASTGASLLAAGFLRAYPVAERFMVFLLPIVVLCLAEGIARIARQPPRPLAAGLLFGVAALILAPVVGGAAKRAVAPPKREEIKPLLQQLATAWRPGDVLYLYPQSQYAFRYYSECEDCGRIADVVSGLWPSRPTAGGQRQTTAAIVSESPALVVGEDYATDLEPLKGERRVWLLFTHFFPRTEAELLGEADRYGVRLGCMHGGASLLCSYDLSRTPVGTTP